MPITVIACVPDETWCVNGKSQIVQFGDKVHFESTFKAQHFLDLKKAIEPERFDALCEELGKNEEMTAEIFAQMVVPDSERGSATPEARKARNKSDKANDDAKKPAKKPAKKAE